ncbi:mitochondrial amidoxime-reducing component 1-like [Anopheles bellator]|uniref:mitochondrial amidoxime-reducing component 1-like n=1 Tax=Anopheles bellator TaxID=139047 RepID=UPI00264860ED|nr:mitochondrial amidoxime-reducing component 1-like [Anopheles bellator]XP_058064325.1 mitochondrial amidoxime-reducing component 1-like [Anopheles bellator]
MFSKALGEWSVSRQTMLLAAGLGGVTVLAAGAWLLKRRLDNTPPQRWQEAGVLTDIYVYPIKSCGAIVVPAIGCAGTGPQQNLLRDRTFVVTTEEGKFVTARMKPKMVLVVPRFDDRCETMFLTAPGMPELRIDVRQWASGESGGSSNKQDDQTPKECIVWGEPVTVVDCGEEVARWFSRYLVDRDTGYRLRYYPHEHAQRRRQGSDTGALHDETSYMLFNEASVTDLNHRLDNKVGALQFRPNFVVRGPKAYAEDRWRWVRIGEVVFRYRIPCLRCVFTTIDPETGIADPAKEPLRTLKEYRQIPALGESPAFGIHLGLRGDGTVKVGDPVYVA